jgi:ribonuclease HI
VTNVYRLFTDGACKANGTSDARGGWAYLIKRDDLPGFSMEQTGQEFNTTNNRMEMMAVIEGLRSIPDGAKVEIITDSRYVITVVTSRNTKLKNLWLIGDLRKQLAMLDFLFTHVKGHSGHPENEHVDRLASMAAQGKIGLSAVRK